MNGRGYADPLIFKCSKVALQCKRTATRGMQGQCIDSEIVAPFGAWLGEGKPASAKYLAAPSAHDGNRQYSDHYLSRKVPAIE